MKRFSCIVLVLFLTSFFVAPIVFKKVYAQESQILSVTPPLFQLSVLPGDVWQSSVKVVNGNRYPMTVYAEVVNFQATGESGQGKFIPILEADPDRSTFASWIVIAPGPHVIDPEKSADISFFVDIPKDAAPGGHYAAILVTTQPSKDGNDALLMQTSQAVTTLFFLRVEGDVDENATIREFRTTKSLLQKPEAEFSLRFENKGNVHLQPKGDIVITNMWGAERGKIPVNYQTHFGNVLPRSIRDFKFTWSSDFKIADIGRYKAITTLAYGEQGIKSVTAVAYFWVIPIKATIITILVLISCIVCIAWMVRAYVRRMLILAGVDPDQKKSHTDVVSAQLQIPSKTQNKKIAVSAPLTKGVLDLRTRLHASHETLSVISTIVSFVVHYKKFFISVTILVCIFIGLVQYIGKATEDRDNFTVTVDSDVESQISD